MGKLCQLARWNWQSSPLRVMKNMLFPYQCTHSLVGEEGLGRPGSVSADPGSVPVPAPVFLPAEPAGAVFVPQL